MTLRTRISISVAKICNLLYCRIAFGSAWEYGRPADYKSAIQQNTILRYVGRCHVLCLLLAILCCPAGAQTAEDFFHSGAQSYLTNNVQLAIQRVDEGLKRFPDDPKLKKLEELLKKQQQQQQQQNQDQQNQKDQQQSKSDQNKDQKDQKDQKRDQKQNSDQQKKQNEQKQDQQSKQDQAKKDQEKKDQQKPDQQQQQKKDQKSGDESQQQAKYVPGQMTPQQAKQLLDAQKGEEMMMPVKVEEKPRQRSGPVKDW